MIVWVCLYTVEKSMKKLPERSVLGKQLKVPLSAMTVYGCCQNINRNWLVELMLIIISIYLT